MTLSPRERSILELLRDQPLLDAAGLARALGTSKGAVAVALSSLSAKGEIVGRGYVLRDEPWAVVVGGAAMDIKARSLASARAATSNPGTVSQNPGGVGRNIAEGLARLGSRVHLVAPVGADTAGRELLNRSADAGVYLDHIVTSQHPTASYLAVLDSDGELLYAVSDFMAVDSLDVEALSRSGDLLAKASVVVIDSNLPVPVAEWALASGAHGGARVVVEPVSVVKAARIAPLLAGRAVYAITPNVDELQALVGHPLADTVEELAAAAATLHARGVEVVWVSRGRQGSLIVPRGGEACQIPVEPVAAVDVTGAGDAMTAGFVHGLLQGEDLLSAARLGHRAAALTVASRHTVLPDLATAMAESVPHHAVSTTNEGVTR